jgi:hypothetical protein
MIFWINVPLGLGSLALLLPRMGKIPVFHRRRKVDWLGGLLPDGLRGRFHAGADLGRQPLSLAVPSHHGDGGASIALAAGVRLACPQRPKSPSCRCR